MDHYIYASKWDSNVILTISVLFRYLKRVQEHLIKNSMRCLVDVISNISFSVNAPLFDEELIDLLFEYITLDQSIYRGLSPQDTILFKEGILKPSLSFRMFLLQLLLKNRYCFKLLCL